MSIHLTRPGITWILSAAFASLALLQLSPPGSVAAPAPAHPCPLKEPIQQSVHKELGLGVALNSDGSRFVASSTEPDYTAAIVRLDRPVARKTIVPVKGGGYPSRYRWSKDDKMIAYACAISGSEESPPHNILFLIDGNTGKAVREFRGHQSEVVDLTFSPNGKLLASAGYDLTVRLWDVSSGRSVRVLKGHSNAISAVAFSYDGKRLASADREELRLWDVDSGKLLKEFKPTGGTIYAIDFHPRKDLLAISMSNVRANNTSQDIELWNVHNSKKFKKIAAIHIATKITPFVAFHPAGHHVAAYGDDGEVFIWEIESKKLLYTLKHRCVAENGQTESPSVWRLSFSANGKYLAVATKASGAPSVTIWDLSGRKK